MIIFMHWLKIHSSLLAVNILSTTWNEWYIPVVSIQVAWMIMTVILWWTVMSKELQLKKISWCHLLSLTNLSLWCFHNQAAFSCYTVSQDNFPMRWTIHQGRSRNTDNQSSKNELTASINCKPQLNFQWPSMGWVSIFSGTTH